MSRRERLSYRDWRLTRPPRGHIDGLVLSHDTDHDIALSNGECALIHSSTSTQRIYGELSSTLVKQLDADWAAGSAAGGIATGARSVSDTMNASTWYHYFLIGQVGGAVDAGVDTDIDATNLLADATDYSFYRRIGSIYSDASNNVTAFVQRGDHFLWDDPPLDVNESVSADVGNTETHTLTVAPVGALVAFTNVYWTTVGALYIYSADITAEAASTSAAPLATESYQETAAGVSHAVHVDSSGQVKVTADATGTVRIATLGWIDSRGRDS